MIIQSPLYPSKNSVNQLLQARKTGLAKIVVLQETAPSPYIRKLSALLLSSEKVVQNASLRSGKWTKGCYEQLSLLITKNLNERLSKSAKIKLGTSLSSKTLQKIMTNTYKLSSPIDPRSLNTLNKVVIFLGFDDWNDFVYKQEGFEKNAKDRTTMTLVEQSVRKAVASEFRAYFNLTLDHDFNSTSNIIQNSPAYNSILEVLDAKNKAGQTIANPYNVSCYEVLELKVTMVNSKFAQVCTREYWFLNWWDVKNERYAKRFKNISDHIYILQKDREGLWRVRTNASTSDILALI